MRHVLRVRHHDSAPESTTVLLIIQIGGSMEILENLGRRVKEKRGAQGIRLTAKQIGISHATLSRVERGFLPDLENYKKLLQWLGVENETSSNTQTNSQPSGVAYVHFRKDTTTSP